ncbi:hypothetical protein OUZ56_002181 [Daphnia magna]|uniref:AB hydrolase-1 domain-containing protein n=1 Tax=Daphnia magna TaxID=35525 RepID=A0ABR0A4X3_9CRUS|nr:hypothetical protein OUZ56_002181 [Daphnia magna]
MANESENKLLFRMHHIIPRGLTSSFDIPDSGITLPPSPQDIEIQMTWGKVAAKAWGPVNGRPLIAIHGWLDNCGTFDTLIPLLPKDLRIIAVDIPGHGLSSHFPPDIAYNYVDTLLAVERMFEHFQWKKCSFLVHSLGGATAMLYAGVFPDKVEKVICLDIIRATPTISATMDVRLRKTVGKLLKYEADIIAGPEEPISYESAVERWVSGTFGSLDEKACRILCQRGLKKLDGGYVFSRDRRLLAAPLAFIPKEDQLILARKTTADVLVIKFIDGPYFEDPEDYQEHMEALRTSSKCVRYVEIEGKHHTHLTHPETVAPIINDFLNYGSDSV